MNIMERIARNQEIVTTVVNTNNEIQDEIFYDKVHTLRNILQQDLVACDAKWTLFVTAAQSYRYETVLFPVPPQFIRSESSSIKININALIMAINDTPRLHVVLQLLNFSKPEELNKTVIELLFWVLAMMADPFLRPLPVQKVVDICKTMNVDIPETYIPTHLFEVITLQESNNEINVDGSNNAYATALAFYGNQLENFYSLLHNGFKKVHSATNSDSENDILQLSTNFMDAISRSPSGAAWGSSACGSIISCVAVCEYIDNPQFVIHNQITRENDASKDDKIEIKNADYLRLRYLLFYGNRTSDIAENGYLHKMNWIKRNGKYLSMILSLAVVITAFSSTQRGGIIRDICSRQFSRAVTFCHNAVKMHLFEFK